MSTTPTTAGRLRATWAVVRRAMRCAHTLARSDKLPRWLRVLFVIGCVQIPVLPVDEIALALALGILACFYRPVLRAAWAGSVAPVTEEN